MAENFNRDVLNELKQSNQRLSRIEQQGVEDDTLKQIVANSLPEVLSDRRIEKQDKKYVERKKMDQTDDEVKALRKETADGQNKLISAVEKNGKNGNNISPTTPNNTPDPDSGPGKEGIKDRARALGAAIGNSDTFKFLKFTLGKLGGFLGGLLKGVAKTGGNILSTLFKAAGLGLLVLFLNSDTFKNFFSEENIKAFQKGIQSFIDFVKNLFNKIFTDENKKMLSDMVDSLLKSIKNIFGAFFGEDGGFLKGMKQIGIELGIINEESLTLSQTIKSLGIAASIAGVLVAAKAVSSFFGVAAGAASGLPAGAGGLRPGSINSATGRLVGIDGKDTTVKKGDKDFKKSQQTIREKFKAGNASKLKQMSSRGSRGAGLLMKGLKRVPFLGMFLGAKEMSDLIQLYSDDSISGKQLTEGISGVLFGLVGSAAGAGIGGALGFAMGGPIGAFLGSLTGGLGGYFFGEEIGLAMAQMMTGQAITAFDNIKGVFSGGNLGMSPGAMGGRTATSPTLAANVGSTDPIAAIMETRVKGRAAQLAAINAANRGGGGGTNIITTVTQGGDTNIRQDAVRLDNDATRGLPDFAFSP